MKKGILLMLSAVLLLPGSILYAQVDLTNTGILRMTTGTDTLYINGNFTNTVAAALVNNGQFHLKGNITNGQASMTAGTGRLLLNGSSAQSVNGAEPFKTYNLTTDNAAGITLNANLGVAAVHTFSNGIIVTSATPNYLIYEAGSSYTGNADARHVNGWVKKMGATDFTFPLGNGTVERTTGVTNLSATSEINAKYNATTPNTANVSMPLVTVDPVEYWVIDKISGGTAQIALNWDNSKVAFPNYILSSIRVAHYTGGNWTNVGGTATGNSLTVGNITSDPVTTFSPFTFGSIAFAIPLDFLSITAQRSNGVTNVEWKTTNEVDVAHYEVERSNTGATFTKIATVAAHNKPNVQTYTSIDANPVKDIAYYRVRSVDKDNRWKYSRIVSVSEGNDIKKSFTVINNPAHNNIYLSVSDHAGHYGYKLTNMAGQVMQKGNLQIGGNGTYTIPVAANVLAGVYVLDITNTTYRFSQKVLIQ